MPFVFLQIQSSGWRRDPVQVGLLRQVISLNLYPLILFPEVCTIPFWSIVCTVFPVRPHKRLASSQTQCHFLWDHFYSIFLFLDFVKRDLIRCEADVTLSSVFFSLCVKISKYFMINVPQISALSLSFSGCFSAARSLALSWSKCCSNVHVLCRHVSFAWLAWG